tara:strand:+ start:116 stop:391 length:276 start_codon:yes stop_codon:yes gene_type:complete
MGKGAVGDSDNNNPVLRELLNLIKEAKGSGYYDATLTTDWSWRSASEIRRYERAADFINSRDYRITATFNVEWVENDDWDDECQIIIGLVW